MKTIFLLIILFTSIFIQESIAQETDSPTRNTLVAGFNLVSLDGGLDIYADAHLIYDRIFYSNEVIKIGGQFSGAVYGLWGVGGVKISPRILLLMGQRNHFFEGTVGANIFVSGDLVGYKPYIPAISIGYRFQKPEGGFVFRSALGFREFLQIGFGYAF